MEFFFFIIFSYLTIHSFILPSWLNLINLFTGKNNKKPGEINFVSIVLPAYNEEECILDKLKNLEERCQELNDKYEVIIGSDGSTDKTVAITKEYISQRALQRWKVVEFENSGKCQTINRLIAQTSGEVIISTDCDTRLAPMAIAELVNELRNDQKVGCVSSVPQYDLGDASIQQKYWSIDVSIREAESKIGKLIVLNGWLYGLRRNAYQPIPAGTMADDLWIPVTIILTGWKCIQCKKSVAMCDRTDEDAELQRRRRVIVGGMDVVRRLWPRIVKSPLTLFLILSHKVNRWFLFVWLMCCFFSLLAITDWNLFIVFGCTFAGLLALVNKRLRNILISLAMPIPAFWEVMNKKDFARWDHVGRGLKE